MDKYIRENGSGVDKSPNYLAMCGNFKPLKEWFEFRGLDWVQRLSDILFILKNIVDKGQEFPVFLYKDGRINNGHKRVACLHFLGQETVKAVFVEDEYKL